MSKRDPSKLYSPEKAAAANRCEAFTKAGVRCTQPALKGFNKCRLHLTKDEQKKAAIARVELKPLKENRYAKVAPRSIRDSYERALKDNELLSLRDGIALMDARIQGILQNFDDSRSENFWLDLEKKWASFMYAIRTKDNEQQVKLVKELDDLIGAKAETTDLWKEITQSVEQQRKLIDTEQRRLTALQQMISVNQAMQLMTTLIAQIRIAIYEYVEPNVAVQVVGQIGRAYRDLLDTPITVVDATATNSPPPVGATDAS